MATFGELAPPAPQPFTWRDTWPVKLAQSVWGALALPGDVYQGNVSMMGADGRTNPEVINRAADLAGVVTGGSYAAPAVKGASGMGIRAYHGSPHDFDRFDLSKIGTGEGAQAYGHGLYFAENPNVAIDYRNRLTPSDRATLDAKSPLLAAWPKFANERGEIVLDGTYRVGDPDEFVKLVQRGRTFDAPQELVDAARGHTRQGRMYEVNINARPDQFLDWDKPLFRQTDDVRGALEGLGIPTEVRGKWTVEPSKAGDKWLLKNVWGETVTAHKNRDAAEAAAAANTDRHYQGGAQLAYQKLGGNPIYNSLDKGTASTALREAGIPGIKYLDQGSRPPSQPAMDKMLRDARSLVAGAQLNGDPAWIAKTKADLTALEKRLSDLQTNETRNYVVFDDSIIDILRKYGLAGAAPAGAMFGSLAPQDSQ